MEDYQGKLSGKTIDNLPKNIADLVDGKVSVGISRDLYSPTDVSQTGQEFILRTTGGTASVKNNGEAMLLKIRGNYTRVSGNIVQTTPSKFRALGLNSFDRETMVISGYTIDENGNIVSDAGKNVYYCRCAETSEGYTVFDASSGIEKLGWCLEKPGTTTTGITLVSSTPTLGYVDTSVEKYIVVVLGNNNPEYLCIHPKWSGYMDKTFAAYSESIIDLPSLPLYSCGNYRDEMDFGNGVYTKRVTREAYSEARLQELLSQHPEWEEGVDYIYDTQEIYYSSGSSTQTISVSPVYYATDFSVEEFIGTEVKVYADLKYKTNLVDKLRNDVVVKTDFVEMKAIFSDGTEKTYKIGKENV